MQGGRPTAKPHHARARTHVSIVAAVAKCRAFPVLIRVAVVLCKEIVLRVGDLAPAVQLRALPRSHSFPLSSTLNVEHKSVAEIAREGGAEGGREESFLRVGRRVASAIVAASAIEVEN